MPTGPITRLGPDDLAQLETLLRDNHLPTRDCAEQLQNFFGVFDNGELIATGGLEPAGEYALLRSVAVRPDYRSRGLGSEITEYLLSRAREQGVAAVYLLTETAETYFQQRGFEALERGRVPPEIANTLQFKSLCPASASCMCLPLPLR